MAIPVPLSELIVPEGRQRHGMDLSDPHISELANSIATVGLLHAPVVRKDDKRTLVAGGCRSLAFRKLQMLGTSITYDGVEYPPGVMPCVLSKSDDPTDVFEAELEENIRRKDLSWQDRSAAIVALHDLRERQQGHAPTATAIAREIEHGEEPKKNVVNEVSTALLLKDKMSDPDVARAKTQKDAVKIARKKVEQEILLKQAAEFNPLESPHTLIHGDSRLELPKLPAEKFSVIITDPPYGTERDSEVQRDGLRHEYDDSETTFWKMMEWLPAELYRVAAIQSHLYLFCDLEMFYDGPGEATMNVQGTEYTTRRPGLRSLFTAAGWTVFWRPLIWDKGNVGHFGGSEYWPRRVYECVLYAIKGQRKVISLYPDVIRECPSSTNTMHPAEKPTSIYLNLLRRSVRPGEHVLDCFSGRGNLFPAAAALKCVATCIEMTDIYHAMSLESLKNVNASQILHPSGKPGGNS